MAEDGSPIGQKFSLHYVDRSSPLPDSQRMRVRLGRYCVNLPMNRLDIVKHIQAEVGADVPVGNTGWDLQKFFVENDIHDVLDSVTEIWKLLVKHNHQEASQTWLSATQRVMTEENLAYWVDAACGVHRKIDQEFDRNLQATIKGLTSPRLRAVLSEFEMACRRLDETPPDSKGCVRSAFEAVEILLKLMAGEGKIKVLGPTEVGKFLRPMLAAAHADDDVAKGAANKMMSAFSKWVVGAQPYRHGQRVEEYTAPPLSLAVAFLSAGATYIRWLLEIEAAAGSRAQA